MAEGTNLERLHAAIDHWNHGDLEAYFREGRVVERWSSADRLGLLVQLGAVPAPA